MFTMTSHRLLFAALLGPGLIASAPALVLFTAPPPSATPVKEHNNGGPRIQLTSSARHEIAEPLSSISAPNHRHPRVHLEIAASKPPLPPSERLLRHSGHTLARHRARRRTVLASVGRTLKAPQNAP